MQITHCILFIMKEIKRNNIYLINKTDTQYAAILQIISDNHNCNQI
jgi:hypothetical protein